MYRQDTTPPIYKDSKIINTLDDLAYFFAHKKAPTFSVRANLSYNTLHLFL